MHLFLAFTMWSFAFLCCSYGRHPFKISCLHVIHRNCLLQLLYKPSLMESLQIYLLFRQFENISEKQQRRGSQASHLDTIFFSSFFPVVLPSLDLTPWTNYCVLQFYILQINNEQNETLNLHSLHFFVQLIQIDSIVSTAII